MSYARFSEGDVYLIGTQIDGAEEFYCCGCLLNVREWVEREDDFLGGFLRSLSGEADFHSPSRAATYQHLLTHTAAGHNVPGRAFERIAAEEEWGTP